MLHLILVDVVELVLAFVLELVILHAVIHVGHSAQKNAVVDAVKTVQQVAERN